MKNIQTSTKVKNKTRQNLYKLSFSPELIALNKKPAISFKFVDILIDQNLKDAPNTQKYYKKPRTQISQLYHFDSETRARHQPKTLIDPEKTQQLI